MTYTHAEIKMRLIRRLLEICREELRNLCIHSIPNVNIEKLSFGFAVGSTKAFTQDSNKLIMPGYVIVNPYVSYRLLKNLTLNVNANNVFNSFAITEAEEGSLEGTNGIIRARTLPGRTFGASVKFDF